LGEIAASASQTQQHLGSADVEMADQKSGGGEGSVPKPDVDVEMSGMPRAVSRPGIPTTSLKLHQTNNKQPADELATRKMKARKDMRVPVSRAPAQQEEYVIEQLKADHALFIKGARERQQADDDRIHALEDDNLRHQHNFEGQSKVVVELQKRFKVSQAQLGLAVQALEKKEDELLQEKANNEDVKQKLQAAKQDYKSFSDEFTEYQKNYENVKADYNKLVVEHRSTLIELQASNKERDELEYDLTMLHESQQHMTKYDQQILDLQAEVEKSMGMLEDAEAQNESLKQEKEHYQSDHTRLERINAELNEQLQRAHQELQTQRQQDARMLSPVRHIASIHRSLDHELSGSAFNSPITDRFDVGGESGTDAGTQTDIKPINTTIYVSAETQTQSAHLDFSTVTATSITPITPEVTQMSEGSTQTDAEIVKQMTDGATQTDTQQMSEGATQTDTAELDLSSITTTLALSPIRSTPNETNDNATQTDLEQDQQMDDSATPKDTQDVAQMSDGADQPDTQDVQPAQLGLSTIITTLEMSPITPTPLQTTDGATQTNPTIRTRLTFSIPALHINRPIMDIQLPRLSTLTSFILTLLSLLAFGTFLHHYNQYAILSDTRNDWVQGNEFTRQHVVNLRDKGVWKHYGREVEPGPLKPVWMLGHWVVFALSLFVNPNYYGLMVDLGQSSAYGERFLT